jgi:hypothetical protein
VGRRYFKSIGSMEPLEEIEDYELVVEWNDAGNCIKLDELGPHSFCAFSSRSAEQSRVLRTGRGRVCATVLVLDHGFSERG